ncbi:hypothetical protein AKG34_21405 [Peribacillus butanolivorans]|uniref:hypothetical protein n=1 Tax=Peribacillus butanolivorans TaxID=421767 RepID=UPI0006A6BBA6|nr:hypothetical protein [Peribacillus butanolivorans]KON67379.1 hypothetical protein AKG34_21405 [Peribacillus butanolivorans]
MIYENHTVNGFDEKLYKVITNEIKELNNGVILIEGKVKYDYTYTDNEEPYYFRTTGDCIIEFDSKQEIIRFEVIDGYSSEYCNYETDDSPSKERLVETVENLKKEILENFLALKREVLELMKSE